MTKGKKSGSTRDNIKLVLDADPERVKDLLEEEKAKRKKKREAKKPLKQIRERTETSE